MMKKQIALLLAVVLFCTACLSACGNATPEYKVTVVDALGKPYTSGVIARFMQGSTQIAMQPVDANGIATKELDKGDYTVELMFTAGEDGYHYEKEGLSLSGNKTELTVVLANKPTGQPSTLTNKDGEVTAYTVGDGCTYVTLEAGKRNYFLYSPKTAGTYEFSVPGSTAAVGYYGSIHFIQENSAAEVKDNKFTISVTADMVGNAENGGGNVFVLGLDADANTTGATLAIQRIGDPAWSVSDEPWTIYEAKTAPKAYTLPAGAQLTAFDLTASGYELVLNEKDGYYHLNTADGPLVLMSLGEKVQYINPYQEILDHTGVVKYFYDGEELTKESFIRKESYSECLLEYIKCMDKEKKVYPLTEDLKYIVQQHGDHQGWWNEKAATYLFLDENGNKVLNINKDIAWLLMCYYIA